MAAVLLAGLAVPSIARSAQVEGVVFNDFNTNGVRDTPPTGCSPWVPGCPHGAVDRGVAGLTVRAFTRAGREVGSTETGPDGAYALDLPGARVRLELEVAGLWWPTRQLEGLRSDVQFVDARTAREDVNFGVHRLGEFSIRNPLIFWPTHWAGSPAAEDGENFNDSAIRGMRYFERPDTERWQDARSKRELATFGQVGTIYGLGVDQTNGDLYAGAYYKRFAGLTGGTGEDERTGAIFRIRRSGEPELWANLPAGDSDHPDSTEIEVWVRNDQSWDLVGKRGLGSVKVGPSGRYVYAVNLFDKRLYRLPIGSDSPLADGSSVEIDDPGCADGDWQPFSIGFDPADGRMYVGGVCSAETEQDPADLRAVVYRVGRPGSRSPNFTPVLNVSLTQDYRRVSHVSHSEWRPWPTRTSLFGGAASPPAQTGQRDTTNAFGQPFMVNRSDESYPQLAAITFDTDGSMILGFRDLMGDMTGWEIPGEPREHTQGDFLRASRSDTVARAARQADGGFNLESAGIAGGRQGFGFRDPPGPLGPGGGYFYDPRPAMTQGQIPTAFQGGTTQVPGFADVVTTSMHVLGSFENGLVWYPNEDGTPPRRNIPLNGASLIAMINRVQNQQSIPGQGPVTGFGKANGLGDLDSYRRQAPVQIGNRLWYDRNRDGLQGANERPVRGAVVELVDAGDHIESTRTDRAGEYVFAVEPDARYTVRVPLRQRQLRRWRVTRAGAGSNRRIDSNGRRRGGYSTARVAAHGVGENDHSYDFGFHRPPPPEPPPPEPPPPTDPPAPPGTDPPPPQDAPEVAGQDPRPLLLVKLASRDAARPGDRVRFKIIVRNPGPNPVLGVRVCDRLPGRLVLLDASGFGRDAAGGRVCSRRMRLDSGATRKLHVRARVGRRLSRAIVNCATATADEQRARACEAVRGLRDRPPPVTG